MMVLISIGVLSTDQVESYMQTKKSWGFGILSTAIMNKCLMIKWWWKIMTTEEDTLCLSIPKAKYFPISNPMFASSRGGSQFWEYLVKVRPIWKDHIKFVVGNGASICFWLDNWCGDSTLSVAFPHVVFLL